MNLRCPDCQGSELTFKVSSGYDGYLCECGEWNYDSNMLGYTKPPTEAEEAIKQLEKRLHNAELAVVFMAGLIIKLMSEEEREGFTNFAEQYFDASESLGAFSSTSLKTPES